MGDLPRTAKWFYENRNAKSTDLIDDHIVDLLDDFKELQRRVSELEEKMKRVRVHRVYG